jgi:hypothetical protein
MFLTPNEKWNGVFWWPVPRLQQGKSDGQKFTSLLEWHRKSQPGASLLQRVTVVEELAENCCG